MPRDHTTWRQRGIADTSFPEPVGIGATQPNGGHPDQDFTGARVRPGQVNEFQTPDACQTNGWTVFDRKLAFDIRSGATAHFPIVGGRYLDRPSRLWIPTR